MQQRPSNPAADDLIGRYFPVLDHGFVALVDYMGTDECIERAARCSYGSGTRKTSETRTLLRYLRRHRHTSPSEQVEIKLHMAMPIFVARQLVRHRTANLNEYSGRYSLMPMLFYTPEPAQFQAQSGSNRQGRAGEALSEETYSNAISRWETGRRFDADSYKWLTEQDVSRELARIDLPLSTYTQWYWKIDLHNLMHFLTLRVDTHAQWETRQYGLVMAGMLQRIAPLSYEAWMDYDVNGVRLSRQEWAIIRSYLQVMDWVKPDGVSEREMAEFKDKFAREPLELSELDLSKSVDGTVFEERWNAAAPK